MQKSLFIVLLCGGLWLALSAWPTTSAAWAAQGAKKSPITEGGKLFNSYCISCHGKDATGTGPVAASLKKQPANLTRIKLEDGKFPFYKIEEFIAGEQMTGAHGTREMPVWGSILRRRGGEGFMKLELYNLTKYLESIQQK